MGDEGPGEQRVEVLVSLHLMRSLRHWVEEALPSNLVTLGEFTYRTVSLSLPLPALVLFFRGKMEEYLCCFFDTLEGERYCFIFNFFIRLSDLYVRIVFGDVYQMKDAWMFVGVLSICLAI